MAQVEKVITRNWGKPDSYTLDGYKKAAATQALKKALEHGAGRRSSTR